MIYQMSNILKILVSTTRFLRLAWSVLSHYQKKISQLKNNRRLTYFNDDLEFMAAIDENSINMNDEVQQTQKWE